MYENKSQESEPETAPKNKKLFYIILIASISFAVILALTLGLVFGLKKGDDDNNDEDKSEEKVNIMNSYDNTDELIEKFPVINPTPVHDGIEKKIQNRLLTGFENWNRGFKAWKEWGNILYTTESIYNVHGARLSLQHYQDAMDISLQRANILMGDFYNMLIVEQYCAIRYEFSTNGIPGTVMEFVRFKDYGNELGTRVEEGWGSTKDISYDGLTSFQGDNEKRVQEEQIFHILNYHIPTDVDTDLNKKYPIKYKTTHSGENAAQILNIILLGFDAWNQGITQYEAWVDAYYSSDAKSSSLDERERVMTDYKEEIRTLFGESTIKKLYFDNLLIRENWAALHYRYTKLDNGASEDSKYPGDRMEFFQFQEVSGSLKIVGNWVQ